MTGTGSTRRRSPARLGRLALGRVTTRLSLVKAGIELGSVERRVCRATRSSDLAVVVHVYYSEVWAEIAHRLRLLGDDVDLYVTLAGVVRDFEVTVLADFPAAHVMVVPNVGRDVLPFITVARGLRRSGYTSVLKLHTKRSVHADDGAEFLAACLDDLVPSAEVAHQCRELVTSGGAALVGPQSRYYPLAIHVWLNHGDLDWFLARRGHTPSAALQHPSRFGFFAGTMFWANLDRVAECLDVPEGPGRARSDRRHHGSRSGAALRSGPRARRAGDLGIRSRRMPAPLVRRPHLAGLGTASTRDGVTQRRICSNGSQASQVAGDCTTTRSTRRRGP